VQSTRTTGPKTRLPESEDPDAPSLFDLAPGGVYLAALVTKRAVRSYRTLSPLPAVTKVTAGGLLSVALSLGSPPPGVTRHRVSVEPGLSSRRAIKPDKRPSSRLILTPRYRLAQAWSTQAARTPATRSRVWASACPSMRAGRKWRWNAATTLAVSAPYRPSATRP